MPENYAIDENVPCASGSTSALVLIVGYTEDHYIVKGSWGNDISEDGYFRIKMGGGGEGICGINSRLYIPDIL
jgi:hypothetical protein